MSRTHLHVLAAVTGLAVPLAAAGALGVVGRPAEVAADPLTVAVATSPDLGARVSAGTAPEESPPESTRAPQGQAAPDAPTSTTLARSAPTRLRIPAISVDSELVGLDLQADGRMEVPSGAFPAGWYTGAPTPGELGPAVLAGHVDYGGELGVFHRLVELRVGDTVEVDRADGSAAVFRVTRVEQHRKDAFPTMAVYGDIDHAGLRLITCGGPFDRQVGSYEDNIVVFAELQAAAHAPAPGRATTSPGAPDRQPATVPA